MNWRIITIKEAYYFSHDSNSRHDPRIVAMKSVYGGRGYGWYWILIEMMRESSGYKLEINNKYDSTVYAIEFGCESKEAERFIKDCINEFKLFKENGNRFWSESLMRRMEKKDGISEKRRQAGRKGGKAKPGQMTLLEDENEPIIETEANDKQTVSIVSLKGKKIKENKINKEKNKKILNNEVYETIEKKYFELFQKRCNNDKPDYNYGRDRKILKQHIEKDGVEKILKMLEIWFLNNIGDWNGYTIKGFSSDYNKILIAMKEKATASWGFK